MTTETKAKRNTDYSGSAVNLCNPPTIKELMEHYQELDHSIIELTIKSESYIPQEIKDGISKATQDLSTLREQIKTAIDIHGSWQDLESGHYAVKQKKISYSYDASLFADKYPDFAPAVIVKTVDTAKLNGLIKGGLIKQEDLLKPTPLGLTVAKAIESYAYIIK